MTYLGALKERPGVAGHIRPPTKPPFRSAPDLVISKSVGKEVKKTAQIMGSNITVTWTVVESYPVNADDDPGHSLLFVLFLPSYLLSSSLLSVLPSLPSPFPPSHLHERSHGYIRRLYGAVLALLQSGLIGTIIFLLGDCTATKPSVPSKEPWNNTKKSAQMVAAETTRAERGEERRKGTERRRGQKEERAERRGDRKRRGEERREERGQREEMAERSCALRHHTEKRFLAVVPVPYRNHIDAVNIRLKNSPLAPWGVLEHLRRDFFRESSMGLREARNGMEFLPRLLGLLANTSNELNRSVVRISHKDEAAVHIKSHFIMHICGRKSESM